MQVFCFSIVGGTADFFNLFDKVCSSEIEYVKLEYSGHGSRHKEPLCNNFNEIANDLYETIKDKYVGGEYALLGYSMGCISAIEILKIILGTGEMPTPKHIFLAAHRPKAFTDITGYNQEEFSDYVKEKIIHFGGVPENLIHNNSFWRLYLPLYKQDYYMLANYDFNSLELKVDLPATFFYSESDTPLADMKEWQRYFTGPCEFVEYSGNHFFIKEYYKEIEEIIEKELGV